MYGDNSIGALHIRLSIKAGQNGATFNLLILSNQKIEMHQSTIPFYVCILALVVLLTLAPTSILAKTKHHAVNVSANKGNTTDDAGNDRLPSLCANGATVTRKERERNQLSLETCEYDRQSAIEVFKAGFDVDGDGLFTIDECYEAYHAYIHLWEEPLAESCEKVFAHCDCNADRTITISDFETAVDTCLRNCDTIHMFMKYVGSRMPENIRALIKSHPHPTIEEPKSDQ